MSNIRTSNKTKEHQRNFTFGTLVIDDFSLLPRNFHYKFKKLAFFDSFHLQVC